MTVETLVSTEIEPARSLSPIEDAEKGLAAAQFEAIIRAWKGETVEGVVPVSPVGEVDWDGSLALGLSDGPLMSWTISSACSYLICTNADCPSPYPTGCTAHGMCC